MKKGASAAEIMSIQFTSNSSERIQINNIESSQHIADHTIHGV